MTRFSFFFAWTIALAACSAADESLGRKAALASTGDGGVAACATPSPEGCNGHGCPGGQYCYPTPPAAGSSECAPSSCSCDARTGLWACTRDCGGGVCRYPDDAAPIPRGDAGRG